MPSRTSGFTKAPLLLKLSQYRFVTTGKTTDVPFKCHVEDALLHPNDKLLQDHLPSSTANVVCHQ